MKEEDTAVRSRLAGVTAVPLEPDVEDEGSSSPVSSHPSRPASSREEIEESEDTRQRGDREVVSAGTATTIRRKRKKLKKLTVNLALCRYKVIRDVCAELGWKETEHETDWQLLWTDMSVSESRCMKLRRPQRLNHFPAMHHIARKCQLARHLNRLKEAVPGQYCFHPETFNLPVDRAAFDKCFRGGDAPDRRRGAKTFIIKPDDGACGQGILLTRKASGVPAGLSCVAQRYLNRPLLIDGRKFDLRLYVLVTSVQPLRVFLHHQGLARFATDRYEKVSAANLNRAYMHLTNYSVNKHHPDFQVLERPAGPAASRRQSGESDQHDDDDEDEDDGERERDPPKPKPSGAEEAGPEEEEEEAVGGKRTAGWVREWLGRRGFDVARVWGEIEEVVVKTLVAAQPYLAHSYRSCLPENRDSAGSSCFDLLGFDVLLDAEARPWLIEVNQMPSWETNSPLDLQVKQAVLKEALQMVCPTLEECRLLASTSLPATQPQPQAPAPSSSSSSGEGWREGLVRLRAEQERYYSRGFRRIYPVDSPPPSPPPTPASAAATEPAGGAWGGWEFMAGAGGTEGRGERYAECVAAAERVFANNLWLKLGKHVAGGGHRRGEGSKAAEGMVAAGQGALMRSVKERREREQRERGGQEAQAGPGQEGAAQQEASRPDTLTRGGSWKGAGRGVGGGKRGVVTSVPNRRGVNLAQGVVGGRATE